ncbi:MAG: DnaJ domain-containing protein [Cyanophyceae cyanobacterium]
MFQLKHGLFKYNVSDYYAVLGIPVDADAKQIRQRYLKIAQKLHPDTCKAKDKAQLQQASQLLSKLVNPAYEQLSKERSRSEYRLIIARLGEQLAREPATVESEAAQELSQSGDRLETTYHKLLQSLADDCYQDLSRVIPTVAQLSELNLIYLKFKQTHKQRPVPAIAVGASAAKGASSSPSAKTTALGNKEPELSPVELYIRRAQENLNRRQYDRAVLDLRDALKLEPKNSTCHGLMGIAYLRQKQLGMAKVHINKAWAANSKDPIVIQGKQELDKLNSTSGGAKSNRSADANSKQAGGIFGGLFGGKKK